VTEIQVQNTTISEPEGIRKAAFETFKTLYTENGRASITPQMYPLSVVPKLIKDDINRKLLEEVSQQEIKEALDQMHPDKAPGPDGFTSKILPAMLGNNQIRPNQNDKEITGEQQAGRKHKLSLPGTHSQRERSALLQPLQTDLPL
jgi:hypothetical protein